MLVRKNVAKEDNVPGKSEDHKQKADKTFVDV